LYASPRPIAAQFDITDQAAIERLRRAVRNLVGATLLVSEED
jgi:predicted DNA binding protein